MQAQQPGRKISSKETAQKHAIVYNKPAPDFFEGAILGNGGMGIVVTTRPDGIVLYFGHNNVWDIRIAENNREKLKDFNYVFNKVKNIPDTLSYLSQDKWYDEYNKMAAENYSKPYPKPFPCGSVLLGFDKRKVQLLGHSLDISNGLCTVKLLTADKKLIFLKLFTVLEDDRLLMQLVDANNNPQKNIFNRIRVMADPSTPAEFAKFTAKEDLDNGILFLRQTLPSQEPGKYNSDVGHPKDKAFSLTVKLNHPLYKAGRQSWNGTTENMAQLEAAMSAAESFLATVSLKEGLDTVVTRHIVHGAKPTLKLFTEELRKNNLAWEKYWSKSGVRLSDHFLEELWYRNLYFFNCAAKDGINCPGLFANWSYNNIGTAWHGDYHLNYNVQQPFWMTFSSNHLEKNLPYVNLVEFLMPVSRQWAKEYYNMPGAYFPHSAFPVEMTMNPYPIPDWGWEVSETPWAVQGLWWHYLYSGDTSFLRTRAYEPIKAAVEFLSAFMTREDAHNSNRWKDNNYHVFPTIPPELYGLMPGFKYNYDCAVDLTLIKFVFKAFQKATVVLGTSEDEKKLLISIGEILSHYPDYPTATLANKEEIFVSVPGENDKQVYNVPNALIAVFPGEDFGLHSDGETIKKLRNTYLNQQNEGGNDLVFGNLQAARIGMLDLEQFKRQVNYCLLPNGTATNLVTQVHGRYGDQSDYMYMSKMGIWFENFALPAVINECLMQSYNDTIKLFPNWPEEKDASFENLRAAGAFLVSAVQKDEVVEEVNIISEKGNELRLVNPWGKGGYVQSSKGKRKIGGSVLVLQTLKNERIILRP